MGDSLILFFSFAVEMKIPCSQRAQQNMEREKKRKEECKAKRNTQLQTVLVTDKSGCERQRESDEIKD